MAETSKYQMVTQRLIRTIWQKAEPQPSGCILWTGYCLPNGYGASGFRGPGSKKYQVSVHLVVWTVARGPIPEGKQIDHTCHDPQVCHATDEGGCTHRRCINIDHLRVATPRENTLAGGAPSAVNARKTKCSNGHWYLAKSTAGMARKCRPCQRAAKRAELARRRDEINARKRAAAAVIREAAMTAAERAQHDAIEAAVPLMRSGEARAARENAGLSQRRLGALIGAPQSYIQSWETARRRPTGPLGASYARLIQDICGKAA
jgi:DNA-binding transcriptional regulator YiaG